MKELKKVMSLDKTNYYKTHLSLINCLLPVKMTPMEISVLAEFMSLEGDIAQYRFGPSAKKIVREKLNLSSSGLSNYTLSLMKSGFIYKEGDMVKIRAILNPENNEQMYLFKLINTDNITT